MIYALLIALGLGAIAIMLRQIRAASRKLDDRIEQYHAEGPPADPYSELARLMAEDRMARRPKKARRPGGDKE